MQRYDLPFHSRIRGRRDPREQLEPMLNPYNIPAFMYPPIAFDPYTGVPLQGRVLGEHEAGFGDPCHRFAMSGTPSGRKHSTWATQQQAIHDQMIARAGGRMKGPTKSGVSFGLAMKKLHKQTENAEKAYKNFMTEYDSDTTRIKKYASERTLDHLWAMKLKGKTTENGEATFDDESPEQKFEEVEIRLEKALIAAQESCEGEGDKWTELKMHVNFAIMGIQPMIKSAKDRKADCKEFVRKLDKLKKLVDPKAADNKALYTEKDFGKSADIGNEDGGFQSQEDQPTGESGGW